jgi:aspartate/methionine/tyrosine aminotransferase
MKIEPFDVEEWMNAYETKAVYNIAETCVHSLTLRELTALNPLAGNPLEDLMDQRLTYGDISGNPELRSAIASLYNNISPSQIITTHGAIGANQLVFFTLVEPGDHVVVAVPTYQQLYALPASLGAVVDRLELMPEQSYLPDLTLLRKKVTDRTKMICLNNPNNPTGALIPESMMEEIVEIARANDAWLFCDEVYRGMFHEDNIQQMPSFIDLYDKGIVTGSMSKVFSLAGIRLGWVAGPESLISDLMSHRDYNTISCSMIDEAVALIALQNRNKLWQRNRRLVERNLKILDDWIANEPRADYVRPEAGTTAFIKIESELPMSAFCEKLMAETGTLVVPGSCFEREDYVRIGYANEEATLIAGLEQLSLFLKEQA